MTRNLKTSTQTQNGASEIYAKIGELIGTLNLDGEDYPIKGLSDKTAQLLHRTVCPNCGAPHSPWESKCEYCGGYFVLEAPVSETQLKVEPYAVKQWDGEKFVSKVVNPMERVKTKKLPTQNAKTSLDRKAETQ